MPGRRFSFVFLALLLLAGCAGGPRPVRPDSAPSLLVTADSRRALQRIEHFGASAAWWAQDVGGWPEATRAAILDLLFDPEKGIGLEVVRYNLGGGKAEGEAAGIQDPWRSAECPLRPDGSLDWSRDAAAMGIVDGAVARGAKVVLFCNSPPASMTVTGSPTGNGESCNLRPEAVDAYASYLARCARELSARWPLIALSPINEPQWPWGPRNGQEGCHYSQSEAAGLLARTAAALAREGLALPLSLPESGEWSLRHNREYLDAIFLSLEREPELDAALGNYAVHSYWSGREDRNSLSSLLDELLPLRETWITEWTEMRGGRDRGMRAALALAETLHEDLVHGNAVSWQYWIAVSKYDYADGLLYANPRARSFETTKKLWALGNWSRFVRPGACRLPCPEAPAKDLLVSAFWNPDRSLVFVVVNKSRKSSPPIGFACSGGSPLPASARAWETSARRDLEEVPVDPERPLRFPPQSVTTLVFR